MEKNRGDILLCLTSALMIMVGAGSSAFGQAIEKETNTGKSGARAYGLFSPTPTEYLREMSTDRPDQTESPYTVDAGHFQLELDFVNVVFNQDRVGGADLREYEGSILPFNLKIGLLDNVDIQLVLDPYVSTSVEDRKAETKDEESGAGDFQTRLKVNVWGNNGGRTALAVMPYVKWPLSESASRNGKTEGGLIVPLAVSLGPGWGMGLMAELNFIRNEAGDGYDAEHVQSITFGRDIVDRIGGYGELCSVFSSAADADWLGQIDCGINYGVNDNTQLDLGCNFGVSDAAPDFNPFAGVSIRF